MYFTPFILFKPVRHFWGGGAPLFYDVLRACHPWVSTHICVFIISSSCGYVTLSIIIVGLACHTLDRNPLPLGCHPLFSFVGNEGDHVNDAWLLIFTLAFLLGPWQVSCGLRGLNYLINGVRIVAMRHIINVLVSWFGWCIPYARIFDQETPTRPWIHVIFDLGPRRATITSTTVTCLSVRLYEHYDYITI